MFRTSRPVVSNLLLLAAFILGAAALLAPRHVAAAPAAQAQELMFRVTAGAVEGPRQVQAGLVTFVVENATGEPGFGVFLARLKAGRTLADVQAALGGPEGVDAARALVDDYGGVFGFAPGARVRFTQNLREGTYFVAADPSKGQVGPIEVTAGGGAVEEPPADVSVTMRDFQFVMPTSVRAGELSWKVVNAGPQAHEIAYFQLLPGKTLQDVFTAPEDAPPPIDLTTLGGVPAMPAGVTQWSRTNPRPGRYVAVCFVEDPATRKPHAELGMVAEFTVTEAEGDRPLPETSETEGTMTFPETGYSLDGDFLSYWQAHGGLPVFGYPVDSARQVDGQVVQYLERARFELHAENKAPYNVLLGHLGVEALQRQGRDWQSFPKADASAPHYFPETGHAIAHAPFWQYWSSHGLEFDGRRGTSLAESLALFGYPLSEARMERNSSGDVVLTQWFERARFEYHPNNPGAYRVLLGRLGAELRNERGR